MPIEKPMPGGPDLAQHPTLWGQPLPLWTEAGPQYAHGSHWTPEAVSDLASWLGDCLTAMREWVYGPEGHRRRLAQQARNRKALDHARTVEGLSHAASVQRALAILDGNRGLDPPVPSLDLTREENEAIEDRVQRAEAARKHLWKIASATDPKTRPGTMDELAQWTTRHHVDLVLRLSTVGLVPKPPAKLIPAVMPKHSSTRQAKLDAKPGDPAGEDPFS